MDTTVDISILYHSVDEIPSYTFISTSYILGLRKDVQLGQLDKGGPVGSNCTGRHKLDELFPYCIVLSASQCTNHADYSMKTDFITSM